MCRARSVCVDFIANTDLFGSCAVGMMISSRAHCGSTVCGERMREVVKEL